MSKTTKKSTAIQPMTKSLVSQYESAVRTAYENGEPTIKGMRREMAYNLSRLYIGKAHKTAGFDSFSDYVTATFPFKEVKPSQLCTWARTAAKFFIKDKNGEVHNVIGDAWEQSSLERLNSVDVADIRRAIDKGELSPDMSQTSVRAWVDSRPEKNGKPKVVTMYERVEEENHAIRYSYDDDGDMTFCSDETLDELKTARADELHVHTWRMDDGAIYRFSVYKSGLMDGSVWMPKKPEPKVKHPVGKSKEEVAADALKALDPETLKALVAKILG